MPGAPRGTRACTIVTPAQQGASVLLLPGRGCDDRLLLLLLPLLKPLPGPPLLPPPTAG